MMDETIRTALQQLGWSAFFERSLLQLPMTADQSGEPAQDMVQPVARVMLVQRTGLTLLGVGGEIHLPLGGRWFTLPAGERPTVGDWVVLSHDMTRMEALLERKSLIARLAPGGHKEVQLMAANLDTVFVVTSCNDEFNPSRLERYLSLAREAEVQAGVVLSKADLCDDPWVYADAVRALDSRLIVEVVNALDATTLGGLRAWCGIGQTVALLGSSGVGKSTLLNSLSGRELADTGGIREQDTRGRHTTSHRSLHRLDAGGLLLDSPGMRELHLAYPSRQPGQPGSVFDDLDVLAQNCRFSNCGHQQEPGCAIQSAIGRGELEARRFANYQKLQREQRYAEETVAERHQRVRQFARKVRQRQAQTPRKRH